MEDFDWIDFSSVRLSWGRNIVPTGNIYDVYGKYVSGPVYNNMQTVKMNNGAIPNLELIPTSNTTWNFAIEGGFKEGLFTFTYETYYKESKAILEKKELANHNFFEAIKTNEKAMVNYGHEFQATVRPLRNESPFKWTFSANMAYNKDVATALPDAVRQFFVDGGSTNQKILNRLGRNAFSNVLLHYRGVYATDADVPVDPVTGLRLRASGPLAQERFFKAGDPIWTDLNGDYIIDENDYVFIGNSQPLITGGFSSDLRYKQWALTINGSFTLIRDVLNNANADVLRGFSNPEGRPKDNSGNKTNNYYQNDGKITAWVPITAFDFWQGNGQSAAYPNPYDYLRYDYYNPFRYDQTLFMEDGSYLKINQVTVSYNIDRKVTQRYGITSVRLYTTVGNVYNFNKYSGPDPEIVSALGRDSSGGYPNKRSFTFGLNVQF